MKRPATAPAGLHIESYVPSLVTRAAMAMLNYSAIEFEKLGLTVPKWRILLTLSQHRICRFGELAKLTSIEPPTLSRLLNTMAKAKLITRARIEEDTRSVNVSLTPAGIALFRKTIPFAESVNDHYVAGLSESELAILRRALAKIYDNVGALQAARDSAR